MAYFAASFAIVLVIVALALVVSMDGVVPFFIAVTHASTSRLSACEARGYGLRNVRAAVERNGGTMNVTEKDGSFFVHIRLSV